MTATSYWTRTACIASAWTSPTPRRPRPLPELRLRDPTGYNIEVYARLTPQELAEMPADKRPTFLPGSRHGELSRVPNVRQRPVPPSPARA